MVQTGFIIKKITMKKLTTLLVFLITYSGVSQIDIKNTRKHFLVVDNDTITDSYNKDDPNGLQTALNYLAITGKTKSSVTVIGGYDIDLGNYRIFHKDTIAVLNSKISYLENLINPPQPTTEDTEPEQPETEQKAVLVESISYINNEIQLRISEFDNTLLPDKYDLVINGSRMGLSLSKEDFNTTIEIPIETTGETCVQVESFYGTKIHRSNKKCLNL